MRSAAIALSFAVLGAACSYQTAVVPTREVHRQLPELREGRTVTVADRSQEEIELSLEDEVTTGGGWPTALGRLTKKCPPLPRTGFRLEDEPASDCPLETARSLHIERIDAEGTFANFLIAGGVVGAYSGIVYCAVDCPDPWDDVALVGAIVGGIALGAAVLAVIVLLGAHGPT